MFNVLTIGGAARDIIFVTDRGRIISTPQNLTEQKILAFEYGAKIKSDDVYFSSGGGACNAAVGLSRFGIKTAALLRIGDDQNGAEIKNNLLKEKVETEFIQKDKKTGTSVSFIVVDKKKGDRVIFNWRGANRKLKIENEKLKTKIKNPKWIYLTSLSGHWQGNIEKITRFVKKNKIKLAFNPGSAQIKAGRKKLLRILKSTEILLLNRDEAIELALSCPPEPSAQADGRQAGKKQKNKNFNDPANLIKIIREWGPKIVIVTQGLSGAWVGDKENIYYTKATSKKRIDTTGAGDAFGSGFLGGFILSGENIQESLKYAIINSGNVVRHYGAQKGLLTLAKIKPQLSKIRIENKK
jgi:sugar/nucleoside kinase (ribokinase family)